MLGLGQSMDCLRKAWIHGLRRAIHELSPIHALRTTNILGSPVYSDRFSNKDKNFGLMGDHHKKVFEIEGAFLSMHGVLF